jgi:hypothetical protein
MRQQMLLATALVATQLVGHSAHAQIQPTGSSAWPSAVPAQPPGNLPAYPPGNLPGAPPYPQAQQGQPSPPAQNGPLAQPSPPAQPQPDPGATVPPPATTPSLAAPLLRHAPRVFSFTAGYVYVPLSQLPVAQDRTRVRFARYQQHGLRLDWKAGWQVGGFQSGWGSYVGFFAGFFYHFGGELADSLGINYGIFAKHTLFPSLRVRPFLAYGLGATQVWVRELEGRGIGHVTRLSAGLDTKVSERLAIEVELAYQFNILASFATPPTPPGSYDFHTLSLTAGIWYGR